MKAGIWNLRGASKKGMSTCLTDFIRDNGLDFIALEETMKKNYDQKFFNKIDPGNLFFWKWISSVGKSGGILCGARYDSLDVQSVKLGEFMVLMYVWDCKKKCRWAVIVVYGPAHEEFKAKFLAELVSFCNCVDCPYIVGGDFNILCSVKEKNKPCALPHSSEVFNSVINTLGLREIHMAGGRFTWSNKRNDPTLEKLDRILMSPEWELLFPLVSIKKLVKDASDHCPLVLDSGENSIIKKQNGFKFDVGWLKNDDFLPIVSKIWERHVDSSDPIDIINIKLKRFKKYFKGWGSNLFGHNKKRREALKRSLVDIELAEEDRELLPGEMLMKNNIQVELYNLNVEEET
jgi:exonuclease III